MSQQPQQPPSDPASVPPPPSADASSLIPILLTVLAIYLLTRPVLAGPWRTAAATLKLNLRVGSALANLARRALSRQQMELPTARQRAELFVFHDHGVQEGVDIGMQTLVDILRQTEFSTTLPTAAQMKKAAEEKEQAQQAATDAVSAADNDRMTTHPRSPDAPEPDKNPVITPQELRRMAQDLADAVVHGSLVKVAALAGWDKQWNSKQDARVRTTHAALNAQRIPARDSFTTTLGSVIRYPHDPKAPYGERVGCRCRLTFHRP
jgi:hypothetical protein